MSTQPIGIFDSGVGGLTVLRKLREILPNENLIYLGDTARVPYGNKSPQTIRLYAEQCARFLLEKQVKLIVVACNTISSVALEVVESISHVPVVGVIAPGAHAAVARTTTGKVGVIGTYATIKSQAYETAIAASAQEKNIQVYSQACPLFVPFAEEGWHQHQATYLVAKEYLAALARDKIDTLILGCTHYPLLKMTIHEVLPKVSLIDSGEEAAIKAKDILTQASLIHHVDTKLSPNISGYLTDLNPRFSQIANEFLGVSFNSLEQIALDHQIKVMQQK